MLMDIGKRVYSCISKSFLENNIHLWRYRDQIESVSRPSKQMTIEWVAFIKNISYIGDSVDFTY